jgi:hypothetical protein
MAGVAAAGDVADTDTVAADMVMDAAAMRADMDMSAERAVELQQAGAAHR